MLDAVATENYYFSSSGGGANDMSQDLGAKGVTSSTQLGTSPTSVKDEDQRTRSGFSTSSSQRGTGCQGTLWMGGLDDWMDEEYVKNLFKPHFTPVSVKLMKRTRGSWRSYAFIDFGSKEAAAAVLKTFGGKPMPANPRSMFRLNWAEFGLANALDNEYSLFIGDLDLSVTDFQLQEVFSDKFKTVRSAKVIVDGATGRSRGFGFVRFTSLDEMERAAREMNGAVIGSRPIRAHPATSERGNKAKAKSPAGAAAGRVVVAYGVAPHVSESHLLEAFSGFGPVEKAFTIPVYGVGVVQFRNTSSAASCVENGQGMVISGMPVRIEWGYTAAQNPLFRSSPAMPTTGLLPGADAAHAHAPLAPTSGLDDIIRALSQGSMNRGGWGPQAADQYGYAPPAMFGGPAPMMRGGGQIAPMQPTYQQQVALIQQAQEAIARHSRGAPPPPPAHGGHGQWGLYQAGHGAGMYDASRDDSSVPLYGEQVGRQNLLHLHQSRSAMNAEPDYSQIESLGSTPLSDLDELGHRLRNL